MGIELDVLVGHPEHDLLFVATQVARVAGLKDPSQSVSKYRLGGHSEGAVRWSDLLVSTNLPDHGAILKTAPTSRILQRNSWMTTEAWTYKMLLAGHAPQSEPFRKWVTEEVLPTIRKTGKYNAEESTSPAALRT